ncbi:ABC transporter ATP-binding protein [Oceanobacillus neutriphilus]|uniref:Peptide ABC transporter ATP-binding protein n=1 Tax=Oceanobacillus neutriphilus TaxID=531815 RepID=A0ABQ2NQ17_9BACI|nr:ATP-binding cassette domain-containing protein [Oceanobacillus neutriphilus]GGP07684.1 peptide ABC transporter ATP-binding protein [Oceanobacillus neutriphilus]
MTFFKVNNLKVYYPIRGGIFRRVVNHVKAVDNINFELKRGETYALVGESGCGKTTTGRTVVGLTKATSGEVIFNNLDLTKCNRKQIHESRREIQMVFQDPYSSLNPKKTVYDIVAEPLRNFENLSKSEEREQVEYFMQKVGMSRDSLFKYPHQFSGGQRQRVGIARALTLKPKIIIADEPVSALDASVQAQVLNFMQDIQEEFGLTYLFISHDLGIVRHMCNRIGIMYKGKFVEEGTREDIYENPQHIYTRRLIASIPELDTDQHQNSELLRKNIEEEYQKENDKYFNEDGSVMDLKPVSDTHFAALR